MKMLLLLLSVCVSGPAWAGDLEWAGALSGAGQAFGNSMSMMQSGLIQQRLQEQRAQAEQERDERLARYQRERDELVLKSQAQRQQSLAQQQTIATLTKTHPDWRQVTAEGGAYRQWLASQPQSYQHLLLNSWDAVILGASIDQFTQSQRTSR